MKIRIAALLVILLALTQTFRCAGQGVQPSKSRLGMNLAGPCDWTTEYVFVDVFRMSRQWISQKKDANWGKGPELERDENGWITKLEDNCWAETPILTSNNGHAPSGQYVCLYEGEGEIKFTHNSTLVSREPGRIVVNIDTQKGGTFLALMSTNPTNHVRNIRVIMPGFEQSYKRDPYYSAGKSSVPSVSWNGWKPTALKRRNGAIGQPLHIAMTPNAACPWRSWLTFATG